MSFLEETATDGFVFWDAEAALPTVVGEVPEAVVVGVGAAAAMLGLLEGIGAVGCSDFVEQGGGG